MQTAEGVVAAEPLSSFASIIAAKFTLVLHDPRHILYTKVNEFLNHNPKWRLTKLPSNWIDKIFLLPALDGGTQDNEIEWLLEGLLQGLRYDAVSSSYDLEKMTDCRFRMWIYIDAAQSLSVLCP